MLTQEEIDIYLRLDRVVRLKAKHYIREYCEFLEEIGPEEVDIKDILAKDYRFDGVFQSECGAWVHMKPYGPMNVYKEHRSIPIENLVNDQWKQQILDIRQWKKEQK
jgi:hypothetical protein